MCVVFLDDKGNYYWCLGHIEEIAVASATIPAARCAEGELESAAKTANHRPKVDIDDNRAMYQLRWYEEVDEKGDVLEWYGN